jgi:hypothetical protein
VIDHDIDLGEPDGYTDMGTPVWKDITEHRVPCDLIGVPMTPRPAHQIPTCDGIAENRYGGYNACGPHGDRAQRWADEEERVARCEEREAARYDDNWD